MGNLLPRARKDDEKQIACDNAAKFLADISYTISTQTDFNPTEVDGETNTYVQINFENNNQYTFDYFDFPVRERGVEFLPELLELNTNNRLTEVRVLNNGQSYGFNENTATYPSSESGFRNLMKNIVCENDTEKCICSFNDGNQRQSDLPVIQLPVMRAATKLSDG